MDKISMMDVDEDLILEIPEAKTKRTNKKRILEALDRGGNICL